MYYFAIEFIVISNLMIGILLIFVIYCLAIDTILMQ
jgi:hypothetical protein